MASSAMGRRFARKSRQEVNSASARFDRHNEARDVSDRGRTPDRFLQAGQLNGVPVLMLGGTPHSVLLYGGWVEGTKGEHPSDLLRNMLN
jgi:hypothetical protein